MKRVLLVDKNKFHLAYLYLSRNSNTIPKTTQKVTSNDLINGITFVESIIFHRGIYDVITCIKSFFFNQKAAIPWYKVKVNLKRE